MLFKQIYEPDLAQASYLIGCQANGTAAVVDPRRDISVYLEEAGKNGLSIAAVTETHIHADYLSGARELALGRRPAGLRELAAGRAAAGEHAGVAGGHVPGRAVAGAGPDL